MTKQGLFKTVSIIAIITILSKVVGFARDLVIAGEYGASITSDAYFYAYQIPSLALVLLGGLGGPFHTATIAVFGKRILGMEHNVPDSENKLLNSFITYTFIGFSILAILTGIYALPLMQFIAPSATPELQALAAQFLVIMSPVLVIGGVIGIFYGILNVYNVFFWPSLSPLIASVAIIVAIYAFGGTYGAIVLAAGTLIGSLGMLIVQIPDFLKTGFRFLPELKINREGFTQIGEMLFPAMVGTTIGQTNVYVDMFFVSGLTAGSWSAIVFANRLIQLPIGVLLTAMLVPIFPMFTTFVAKKEFDNLRNYIHTTIMSLWFISFPVLVYILLFAADGIRVLLERKEFDRADTLLVAQALICLSFSMIPYMARDTITRVFYAFDDSKTPLMIGFIAIVVNALMDWLLVGPLGVGGITLSTTIVTFVNMILLTVLIRRKIKDIGLRSFIVPTCKLILASLLMLGFCAGLNLLWQMIIPDTTLFVLTKLVVIGMAGFSFYWMITVMLQVKESKMILDRVLAVAKSRKL